MRERPASCCRVRRRARPTASFCGCGRKESPSVRPFQLERKSSAGKRGSGFSSAQRSAMTRSTLLLVDGLAAFGLFFRVNAIPDRARRSRRRFLRARGGIERTARSQEWLRCKSELHSFGLRGKRVSNIFAGVRATADGDDDVLFAVCACMSSASQSVAQA